MKKISVLALGAVMFTPALAAAQFGEIGKLFSDLTTLINNTLVPLVFGIALIAFLWGMTRWLIWGGSDDESRTKGKNLAIWSVVAFVLMISIFAIANIISGALGLDDDADLDNIPTVPTRG